MLGDLDADCMLPQYGKVARFLYPVRITKADKQFNPVYSTEGALLDPNVMLTNQKEWLTRFDDM